MDYIVAGDSSIHLEGILLNIMSICYQFETNEKMLDYYGFVKNGLVEDDSSLKELVHLMERYKKHRSEVYHRAKYYSENVGTDWEDKVQ